MFWKLRYNVQHTESSECDLLDILRYIAIELQEPAYHSEQAYVITSFCPPVTVLPISEEVSDIIMGC